MYTDTFQTVVMTGGSFALMGIGFGKVGGYENLKNLYMNATPSFRRINSSCGEPREDAFHIFRDPITSDNPWPGLILQTSIGCLWYFCCDQVIVQRSLAAKNLSHAKAGSILAGYLKLIPLFIMIFPGIISRALFPDEVACIDPEECRKYCDNPVGCSNIAYPKLVLELMPHGARGLLVAVMLSAIMSSLTSIFNSASTLFTMDLWRRLRPISSERELLIVGRIFIVALCGVSILWIPLVRSSQGGQLFVYIQSVQGYLGTPIGALFLMALLWHRMTEYGAFWGILIGHLCGIIRMIIDFSFPSPDCDQPDLRPTVLSRVHYTYFGPLLLVLTSFSILVISYLTTPMEKDKLQGVTLWTINKIPSVLGIEIVNDEKNNEEIQFVTAKTNEIKTLDGKELTMGEEENHVSTINNWKWKVLWNMLCGFSKKNNKAWHESNSSEQKIQFLQENKKVKKCLFFNAVLGIMITVFLYGYYR